MNCLFGIVSPRKGENKMYAMVHSKEPFFSFSSNYIIEKIPYDNDTILEENGWFYINKFSTRDYAITLVDIAINSADYDTMPPKATEDLLFVFAVSDDQDERYFQKVGKSALVKKKRLIKIDDKFEYYPKSTSIVINDTPDAVYIKSIDTLFFKKISTISNIFPGINVLYREATEEETKKFLDYDFLILEGFTHEQVHITNRKRIAMAMDTLSNLSDSEINEICQYITAYCPEISDGNNRFRIKTNEDLSFLLYGIGQRFYTTPVGGEKRIANSIRRLTQS